MLAFTPPPRYQVHDQLGHGGFSTVYRAWDELRDDWVAIKVFLKSDDEGVMLCRKEYDRTNALRHPNIIQFYDFGVSNGSPYIAMPYFEQGSMQDRVGEATEEDIWKLIYDIGNALAYIHSLNPPVLHNDLKPDNFLVDDDGGYILADFGISMALNTKLLRSRDMLHGEPAEEEMGGRGPMAYQAPELFKFHDQIQQPPVKASDIWAFGAALYEIATGEPPFGDQGGLYEIVEIKENNSKLSAILDPLPSRFSGMLNNLIFDCLAQSTWERPQAKDLCAQARRALGREPAVPVPPPPPPPPTISYQNRDVHDTPHRRPKYVKPEEQSKSPWRMAAAIVGALLLGGGGMYWAMQRQSETPPVSPTTHVVEDKPPTPPSNKVTTTPQTRPSTHNTGSGSPVENFTSASEEVPIVPTNNRQRHEDSPPPTRDRTNDSRSAHRYYHYVFSYSNRQAAEEKHRELHTYFRGQPVTLYQSGRFAWEIYIGNFRSHEEMNTFQQRYPDFDFPKSRHGDAYIDHH